ncbi:TPA: hypothetical protein EYO63_27950 [Candidatus Poribacteria bacterium]|nr:hypothetical protein [Candidatus Poribacteria bacterium]
MSNRTDKSVERDISVSPNGAEFGFKPTDAVVIAVLFAEMRSVKPRQNCIKSSRSGGNIPCMYRHGGTCTIRRMIFQRERTTSKTA